MFEVEVPAVPRSPEKPAVKSKDPISQARQDILDALVGSTLILGLTDLRLHYSNGDAQMLIIDSWGIQPRRRQRERDCIHLLACKGYLVEMRHNPELDLPLGQWLYHQNTGWQSFEMKSELRDTMRQTHLLVHRNAKGIKKGRSIFLDPSVIRGWVTSFMPLDAEIRSIDFPEIKTIGRMHARTVAIVNCHVTHGNAEAILDATKRIKDTFGISVLVNPIPSQTPLRERIEADIPGFGAKIEITKDDVHLLRQMLATTLRWRAERTRKSPDLTSEEWFSIDGAQVLLREDLINIYTVHDTTRVRVAIPDITLPPQDSIQTNVSPKERGVFFLGAKTPAWIFEFEIMDQKLVTVGDPYRATVRNSVECTENDPWLQQYEPYTALKSALRVRHDFRLVAELMHATGDAASNFLRKNDYPFLVKKTKKEGILFLQKLLEGTGFTFTGGQSRSRLIISDIALRVQESGRFDLLPALLAQVQGDTIVCQDAGDSCSLKPQRSAREIINQFILATAVSGKRDRLPDFVEQITASAANAQDAGRALHTYEEERRFAAILKHLIYELTRDRPFRIAKVVRGPGPQLMLQVQGMKHLGIADHLSPAQLGKKVFVQVESFMMGPERFKYQVMDHIPHKKMPLH